MIYEICLSKRVELSERQVFGLTEICAAAAIALCFMIKSLSSGNQGMVGIYPIKNLKVETQKACFYKIMLLVHKMDLMLLESALTMLLRIESFSKIFFVMVHEKHPFRTSIQTEKSF